MNRSKLDALIMEQEGLNSLSRADIEAVQLQKLNDLLSREQQRQGFYGALPSKLDSLEELKALPFTTDEDLALNAPSLLLTSQAEIQRVLSDATSGTTGTAKRVFYTLGDCENTVRLFMAGLSELIFPGSCTMICMPFSGPYGLGELIAEAVTRLGAKPLKLGVSLNYGELSEVMDREKPDTFVGMPVQLLSLLRFCGKGSLRRALISGDACPLSVTRRAEELLGTRLFPHYGSREMGLGGAVTCPAHEGMHLRENHVIAEIIDEEGRPLPHGQYGELVITTIGMEAMPLIRYRTGDYTRILPPCPCGGVTRRIDAVSRREGEISMEDLDSALFAIPELVDYRAVFDGRLHIDARTVGGRGGDSLRRAAQACCPNRDVTVQVSAALGSDRPMYLGKRHIVRESTGI